MINYTAQDEGIRSLDNDRDYYFEFFCKCRQAVSYLVLEVPLVKGKDVPEMLRKLRMEYPKYAVTAVPMKTFDEAFIEKFGIGVH